jgi:hypothetical protein
LYGFSQNNPNYSKIKKVNIYAGNCTTFSSNLTLIDSVSFNHFQEDSSFSSYFLSNSGNYYLNSVGSSKHRNRE